MGTDSFQYGQPIDPKAGQASLVMPHFDAEAVVDWTVSQTIREP